MCTAVVTFVVTAAEGIAGGVLENYKLNDGRNNVVEDGEGSSALLLENTERTAINDFLIYDSDDAIYEEFFATCQYDGDNLNDNVEGGNLPPRFDWWKYRPPALWWLYICFKYTFYISVLCAFLIGCLVILLMFIDINSADVCSSSEWNSIPITVQRIRVTTSTCEAWIIQFFHIFTMLCVFGWELIGTLHILNVNICIAFTDSVYRLYLQVYDTYDTFWRSAFLNVLFVGSMVFNSYCIAHHFYPRNKRKKFMLTFQLGSQFILGTITVYLIFYLLIPWFIHLTPMQQAIVAGVAPITGAICKAVSRIAIQNLNSVNHPGTSYVLVIATYTAAPIVYRTLQAEIESFRYFSLLCIAHGFVGLIERLSVVLRDHFYVWFYKKVLKRTDFDSQIGMFRTPRTQRLISDLTLCNIIQEIVSLILTNAFVQLYALQFGRTNTGRKFATKMVLQDFFKRTGLAICAEFIFTVFGIFIMTWHLNLPLIRIWRKKWKTLVFVNLVTASILVLYTTQHLVEVVQAKYKLSGVANQTVTCDPSELLFFR